MKKFTNFITSLFFVVLSFYFSVNSVLADMLPPGDKFYKVPKSERKEILEIITPKYVFIGFLIIVLTIYSFSLIYKLRNGLPIFGLNKKKFKKSLAENIGEDKKEESFFSKFEVFILMILTGFLGGSITTATVIAKQNGLAPLSILFFRYFIVFFCMLLVVIERKELSWKKFKDNFVPSFFMVLNPVALFYAIKLGSTASVSILIYAVGPLLTALYFFVFKGKKLNNNQITGLFIGFVGVFLILFQPLIINDKTGSLFGNLLVFLATMFFVTYTIISAKKQVENLVSPYSLIFYASVIAMLISFYPMTQNVQEVKFELKQILALGWLGVMSTVIFFILFQYLIKKGGAFVASVYAYLQATLGAIIGVVVLEEKMTILVIIGAILTFVGARIVTKKVEKKKEEIKQVLKSKTVTKKVAKKVSTKKVKVEKEKIELVKENIENK